MQLDYNINVLTKHLCYKHFKNKLQFILHLNHPDFNRSKYVCCFTILLEQFTLNVSGIHNRITLGLFSYNYSSVYITKETAPQI